MMSWEVRKILDGFEQGEIPPDFCAPVEIDYLNDLVTEGLRAHEALKRIDSIINNADPNTEAYRNLRDVLDKYFNQETF
jgi:hypothetical protein